MNITCGCGGQIRCFLTDFLFKYYLIIKCAAQRSCKRVCESQLSLPIRMLLVEAVQKDRRVWEPLRHPAYMSMLRPAQLLNECTCLSAHACVLIFSIASVTYVPPPPPTTHLTFVDQNLVAYHRKAKQHLIGLGKR